MTWYGESYRLNWGSAIGGTAWGDIDDWFDHWDGLSHAVTAGDDVIVGSFAQPLNFDEFVAYSEPVTVRWVLEVNGGSGTLRLSAGSDADFSYTNPALAMQPLGEHVIAGPVTLVTDPVNVTHAELATFDFATILRVECLTGFVDITQVKLRVWPSTGATGAWVPAGDGSTTNYSVKRWNTLVVPDSDETGLLNAAVTDYESYPDPHADDAALTAQAIAIDALASKLGDTARFGSVNFSQTGELASSQNGTGAVLFVVFSPNTYYYTANAYIRAGLGVIHADITNAVPDTVTNGVDPNEHKFEEEASVRPVGGGPLIPTFGGWNTGALEVTYGTSAGSTSWAAEPAVVRQVTISDDFAPAIDPVFGYSQIPYELPTSGAETIIAPGSEAVSSVVETVPLTGGATVMVAVHSPGITGPATSARGLTDETFEGDPVHGYGFNVGVTANVVDTGHLVLFGPVEVYDPAAVAKAPRFYVKALDETMRPVGDGKPASELSVFRVPTAQGWFRDLTTDEYAIYGPDSRPPGGFPLKVKRINTAGEVWWDQVGWMVPDA